MVIKMKRLENIIISDICEVITIYSETGRRYTSDFRKSFGLSFCQSGSITYTINGKDVVSDTSCAVILPYGGNYTLRGTKTGYFPVINFHAVNPPLISDIIKIPVSNTGFYLKEYKKLQHSEIFNHSGFEKMQILYEMLNQLFNETNVLHPALKAAVSYIENNYSDTALTNTVLADEGGISEVYLRKLFINQYGITPKQYIINTRIQKAKQLLSEDGLAVSAIAEKCGFANVYHFCRAFKMHSNMTPSEYKTQSFANPHFLV